MTTAAAYQRVRTWAVGSDPGLLRLRAAVRTTAALAGALLILAGLTTAAGQPVTVALLGVLIAMVSARAVNEPNRRRQLVTLALLPLPATSAVVVSAVLTPHRIAGDVVFVLIMFAAVYVRRFGSRGTALGMVAFMTYFFTLFLGARVDDLPWLIAAVLIGAACTFVMTVYVFPDRPEQVLRRTMRSLRARMALVVDAAADAVRAGRLGRRRQRRLRARTAGLNETALLVQTQIEDEVDPALRWPGVAAGELALRLFDAELAVERVAVAGARAAAAGAQISPGTRAELAEAMDRLTGGVRRVGDDGLRRAAAGARRVLDSPQDGAGAADPAVVDRLARAIIDSADAIADARALIAGTVTADQKTPAALAASADDRDGGADGDGGAAGTRDRLRPTTRQAVQVAVATSLAIVAGELVSPARWYWAVIAAFVVFAGTSSWGETLTKGWQRLLGTVLGVPSGVLVATVVGGNPAASVALIFVCLFFAFYLMKVAYSLMIFWITTMLALLYGLMGQFTFQVLLLRIAETAIGAAIGVAAAILVLPTNTRVVAREDARAFWETLADLITTSVATLSGDESAGQLTAAARRLDRSLQRFRASARPLAAGVGGLASRRGVRRGLRVLTACDHYARILTRYAEKYRGAADPALRDAAAAAAARIRGNINAVAATLGRHPAPAVVPATDLLDAADDHARAGAADADRAADLLTALRALHQIDRAVVDAATDLRIPVAGQQG